VPIHAPATPEESPSALEMKGSTRIITSAQPTTSVTEV
jgi:hypothetical protein